MTVDDRDSHDSHSVSGLESVEKDVLCHIPGPDVHLLYVMSEWEEPTSMSKKILLEIWLPWGLKAAVLNLQVSMCGMLLHVKVKLPVAMTDTMELHNN